MITTRRCEQCGKDELLAHQSFLHNGDWLCAPCYFKATKNNTDARQDKHVRPD